MPAPKNPAGPRYDSETGRAAALKHAWLLENDPEYSAEYRRRVSESMPNRMGEGMFECPVCDRYFLTHLAPSKRRHTCGSKECISEIAKRNGRMGGAPSRNNGAEPETMSAWAMRRTSHLPDERLVELS